jgi:hypothetical protein
MLGHIGLTVDQSTFFFAEHPIPVGYG